LIAVVKRPRCAGDATARGSATDRDSRTVTRRPHDRDAPEKKLTLFDGRAADGTAQVWLTLDP
jgi:hypothetical protein